MTEFKFEEDFLFAPAVKSAYMEDIDRDVYWLNGTGREHSALMKMIGEDKTRQEGWERAVYMLASDEKGKPRYRTSLNIRDFHADIDHTLARNYGMLILGIGKGDEKSGFEMEVDEEVKKSARNKEASSS